MPKIKTLSTHNFLCRIFPGVYWNSVENVYCPLENCTICPPAFLTQNATNLEQ